LLSDQIFDRQQHPFFTPQNQPPANAFRFISGPGSQPLTVGTLNCVPQSESGVDEGGQQQVRALQERYTIADTDSVAGILSGQRSLFRILVEAAAPLHQAFGKRRVLQLRAQFSDEESMLKAVVRIPANFDDPERALRSFDAAWWLENCRRSGGSLVFDYEIQDAV